MGASLLTSFLRDKKDALIQRWSKQGRSDPTGHDAPHVPRIVDELLASVRREPGQDRPSIGDALRELSRFRAFLLDVCDEEAVPVQGAEARLLHAAIDEGMIAVAMELEEAAESNMRRSVAFRDRFMGILGHDLRNPLASIAFTAQSLLERADTPPAQQRALTRIAGCAERMTRMIGDLLDLTRTRAGGGIPITPQPADLHAICRQVIEELESSHPARSIQFEARGEGRGVWDPDRLAQVVGNLVANALDYSPTDTPVEVTVEERGPNVFLRVSNLGAPIPPSEIARIFEPFRRGARVLSSGRSPQGLGLGLFIAQHIVKAHAGDIMVRSALQHGTTFTVRLPRTPGDPAP